MLACSCACGSTRWPGTRPSRLPRPTRPTAPGASWFGQAPGFLGTELYRDLSRADRFLTIDRWRDEQDWRSFLIAFGPAYESLDTQLASLTAAERSLFEGSG